MPLKVQPVQNVLLALLLAAGGLFLRPDAVARHGLDDRMSRLPSRTLWVWERSEDLSGVDPSSTAIAWLDQTIMIGENISSIPRRQSMIYPASVRRIAVVRIEVQPGTVLNDEIAESSAREVVGLILKSTAQPGISALQIDFDATRSQRGFYAALLSDLRSKMPAEMPLSITALASWCSYDDWIGSLPVDEAVPMFFRMEPDRLRSAEGRPEFRIREPLCMGSVGISTRERWPRDISGKRIYIFADRGWRQDMPLLASRRLP